MLSSRFFIEQFILDNHKYFNDYLCNISDNKKYL